MIDDIFYALNYYDKIIPIERHHLSNYAIDKVFQREDLRRIGFSYEDNNIGSIQNATSLADLISTLMPDKWVLIDTGDYIVPENGYFPPEYDNETYDPYYCYYLIPKPVFEKFKDMVFEADSLWREEKQKFANGEIKPE